MNRAAVVALVGALALGVVPQMPGEQTAQAADEGSLDAGEEALLQAKETGEEVEVPSQRSEYATVYANPDGETFTLKQSASPVRVSKPGGGWQEPDPTLVRRSDGSIGPNAAMVGMEFSAGGEEGLARISEEGRSLAVDWPGALPEPVLDGPTATYPDVLLDVDLKVTAAVKGFRQVLVVKTPEAAENPDLEKLDFALKTKGVTVRETASGGMSALDANGRQVFRAPTPHMWGVGRGRDQPWWARPEERCPSGRTCGGRA